MEKDQQGEYISLVTRPRKLNPMSGVSAPPAAAGGSSERHEGAEHRVHTLKLLEDCITSKPEFH